MKDLQKIKEIFDNYSEGNHFSGVALIKDNKSDLFSYQSGYAHRGFKVKNTMRTKFDTASVTKLFTAVGIFQLLDQNLITLNDKVLDILELRGTSISPQVSLYHLLTHTSGIGDDADEEAGECYADLWKATPNYAIKELIDYLPQFIHKAPNFEPGAGCRYNNCAYILLGLIIEKITTQNYRDYIRENIFNKLAMKETDFLSMDSINDNVAEGYVYIGEEADGSVNWKKNIYSYPSQGTADAGAYATVYDLDLFIRELKENKLISKELTQEILTPKERYRENDKRSLSLYKGYGFEFLIRNSDQKVIYVMKDGSNAGVACLFRYYPDIDTTFTIFSNTDACDIWDLADEVQLYLGIEVE